MGTYRPSPTKQNSWHTMKAELRAYHRLQGYNDQIVDTTPRDCDTCGMNYGGFDLVMHIHFGHNLDYSDVCPCNDCVVVQLNRSISEEYQQRLAFAESEKLLATLAASDQDEIFQAAAAPELDTGKNSVSSGQLVDSTPVVQHQNMNVAMEIQRPQQQYSPVQAPPSSSSLGQYAAQGNLAPIRNTSVIRIDSMSPDPNPKSQFTPAETSQTNAILAAVNTEHTRVDSAMSMQSLPKPSTAVKLSQPVKREPKPATTKPKLVPDKVAFFQFFRELSEKNLTYQVSKIECGQMYEENGKVIWAETKADAPLWLDGNDNVVKSIVTGKNMRWCPCLPHDIPRDVPAWQIVAWQREAEAQGYTLRQQDLIDRGLALTASGITGRVQKWQSGIGMLSQARSMYYNWPSKQSMDIVAGLNHNQARFNTWWNVGFAPSHGVWMAIQPSYHSGYRDLDSIIAKDDKSKQPYYFIENPESRKSSEYIKLVDDAMLFLTIKAEECGMTGGYQELLPWFGKPAEDQWTRDLEADLILEFGRWREGCLDSPSVSALRVALDHAGSVAEVEAIKRADYSLSPWLQHVVAGLVPLSESRRSKDAQKKNELAKKVKNRVTEKRKIEEVDSVEMDAGQGKRRAV
ncbi:hypothetical protein MBLNU13_g05494t2 [Cladosporium sp. NU13]